MALDLRPACERCAAALPAQSDGAWICSHECTFCAGCTAALGRVCPNCGGELVRRPRRLALHDAPREQRSQTRTVWTGNGGTGTSAYRAYERAHEISSAGKAPIAGSSVPAFRGDAQRWSPEELQIGSLSACHLLWYLHLCSEAGVIVTAYVDDAEATLLVDARGEGWIAHATLRPRVTIAPGSDPSTARALHAEAHARCFIANSVVMPVAVEPIILIR
jgi:organic hydroperoxide reductase OsmC/OhrA